MRSFSEIDTIAKRASKAVGFSWGIAEEVGKNIRILEMFGLPGLKNLNEYYKALRIKKFQNISLIAKNNSSKISYCPIISGVNFLDQVNTIGSKSPQTDITLQVVEMKGELEKMREQLLNLE